MGDTVSRQKWKTEQAGGVSVGRGTSKLATTSEHCRTNVSITSRKPVASQGKTICCVVYERPTACTDPFITSVQSHLYYHQSTPSSVTSTPISLRTPKLRGSANPTVAAKEGTSSSFRTCTTCLTTLNT